MEHDYENCCCKLNMPDSDDENVIDKECWNKYLQQLNESEGFDIKDYPGHFPATAVFPSPNYLKIPENLHLRF
ncbi:hypothetical protein P3S68_013730 [Capsicum galapagoense]